MLTSTLWSILYPTGKTSVRLVFARGEQRAALLRGTGSVAGPKNSSGWQPENCRPAILWSSLPGRRYMPANSSCSCAHWNNCLYGPDCLCRTEIRKQRRTERTLRWRGDSPKTPVPTRTNRRVRKINERIFLFFNPLIPKIYIPPDISFLSLSAFLFLLYFGSSKKIWGFLGNSNGWQENPLMLLVPAMDL